MFGSQGLISPRVDRFSKLYDVNQLCIGPVDSVTSFIEVTQTTVVQYTDRDMKNLVPAMCGVQVHNTLVKP